jgi:hypothetical protein
MFKGMNEKKTMYGFAAMALAFILVMAPSINFASATTTTTTTTTATGTEQQQQMLATQALTTQQLTSDEQNAGNIQFNIRWGDVQFIQPNSLAILFADCSVGEFAVTGLKIFGSSDIALLEDYPFALPGNTMVWLTVVENIDNNGVVPASVGVTCVNGLTDSATGATLSDETKINIRNALNIAINQGDINIFQIQQVFQSIVQQCNISNNTISNSTVSCNQTATQNAFQTAMENATAPLPPGANATASLTGPTGGETGEQQGPGTEGNETATPGETQTGTEGTGTTSTTDDSGSTGGTTTDDSGSTGGTTTDDSGSTGGTTTDDSGSTGGTTTDDSGSTGG